MATELHSPTPYIDGSTISKVKRVPVGRKWANIEVFERVPWTDFATAARLFFGATGCVAGPDGGGGVDDGSVESNEGEAV